MATEITLPYNWKPRHYQLPLWNYMEGGGKRAIAVWHRRAGKDATGINWCATAAFRRVGLYWHMLPTYKQGRQIVWNGRTGDGRPFLDAFPQQLIKRKREDEMLVELVNGSLYQVVGTDDVDRLVGTNPVGVILSEYSLHDPRAWDYIRPILVENGGWALFIYTARGRNHGYDILELAKRQPGWFAQVLTVDDTRREDGRPVVSLDDIQSEREMGMAEEIIQQEFWCSFDAALVGAYYKDQINAAKRAGRIGSPVPFEPNVPVDTIWDIGVDDATAIGFFQRVGGWIHFIHYLESEGEGIQYYVAEMHKLQAQNGWTYGEHYAPHDIEVREFGVEARTRRQSAAKLGLRFNVIDKFPIAEGIQAARTIFPKVRFNDTKEVRWAVDMLSQYTKEYDSKRGLYKDKPKHDFTSHCADMFKYMALAYRSEKPRRPPQERALTDYSPFEPDGGTMLGEETAQHDWNEFNSRY